MNLCHIRKYNAVELPLLLEIFSMNVPAGFAESEKADYHTYLENEAEHYWVIVLGEKIIGAGGVNFSGDSKTGFISWDLLDPEYQGQGYGKKLLEYRLHFLQNSHVNTIIVRTSQMAFPFYEKSGFVLQSVHKDFWAKGYDMYFMEWKQKINELT